MIHSNGSLSISDATLEGGGNTGQGVIHASGSYTLSNVTIRDYRTTAFTSDLSSTITIALTNILVEDSVGSYNSHLQNGTVTNVSNYSTVTVNNVVLRRLFGGNAAFNIRPDANAQSSITLTGCLTAEAVYPQVTGPGVVDNSAGECSGTIGNGDSAAREIAAPRVSACGLPLEGILVQDATYNLVADCQMTGPLYIPKSLTVSINGNGHRIAAAAGARILQGAGTFTVNNVVFTGSGSGGPVFLVLQSNSIFRHVAFRDKQGPVLIASQTVEFDRVIFELNTSDSTNSTVPSALRRVLSGTVTVRNSIVRNNTGGVAAIYAGISSVHGETPSLTLAESVEFEGNSPRDFANEGGAISDARLPGAVLPADVGPFAPRRDSSEPAPRNSISLPVQTCRELAPEIVVTDLTGHTECQRIGAVGVGRADLLRAGIVDAVDVWSWVREDTGVCFQAAGAAMVFLDASHAPRTVEVLPFERRGDFSCARIPHHGSVVLLNSLPSGLALTVAESAHKQLLNGCSATLNAVLNLREEPQGAVRAVLPAQVTLTAPARSPGWYLVDYHGLRGSVSAAYVTTHGNCD